jgi:hypothetical protein
VDLASQESKIREVFEPALFSIRAGKQQQIMHQSTHACILQVNCLEHLAILLRRVTVGHPPVDGKRNDREGSAQFVTGIGGKLALALERRFQTSSI